MNSKTAFALVWPEGVSSVLHLRSRISEFLSLCDCSVDAQHHAMACCRWWSEVEALKTISLSKCMGSLLVLCLYFCRTVEMVRPSGLMYQIPKIGNNNEAANIRLAPFIGGVVNAEPLLSVFKEIGGHFMSVFYCVEFFPAKQSQSHQHIHDDGVDSTPCLFRHHQHWSNIGLHISLPRRFTATAGPDHRKLLSLYPLLPRFYYYPVMQKCVHMFQKPARQNKRWEGAGKQRARGRACVQNEERFGAYGE